MDNDIAMRFGAAPRLATRSVRQAAVDFEYLVEVFTQKEYVLNDTDIVNLITAAYNLESAKMSTATEMSNNDKRLDFEKMALFYSNGIPPLTGTNQNVYNGNEQAYEPTVTDDPVNEDQGVNENGDY